MDIAATTIWVSLLVLLALAVGGVLLQIFLSKREARWPGLLLPGLTVLYSVLMVCSVAVYDAKCYGTGEELLCTGTFHLFFLRPLEEMVE